MFAKILKGNKNRDKYGRFASGSNSGGGATPKTHSTGDYDSPENHTIRMNNHIRRGDKDAKNAASYAKSADNPKLSNAERSGNAYEAGIAHGNAASAYNAAATSAKGAGNSAKAKELSALAKEHDGKSNHYTSLYGALKGKS